MKLNRAFLFLIFTINCWFNPVFSGENPAGFPYDTVRFIPGVTEYNLVMEGKEQLFEYDTIRPNKSINYYCKLWIKNNSSKTITILTARSNASGKMIADLIEPGRNEEIKPGKSFCINIRPNLQRPGLLNAWSSVFYKIDGKEKEWRIQVCGYIIPSLLVTDPPVITKAPEMKPANPPNKIIKPVKPAKQPEPQQPVNLQPTYHPRPEGVTRYDIGELVQRREDQKDYSFIFHTEPEKHAYGFPPKPQKDVVFSWDTLADTGHSSPVRFQLKNTSKYIVTVLKVEGNNTSVFYCNRANQVLVFPDSVLTIEAIPNRTNKGHFYHSLIVQYLSAYGVEQFEMKQWGYIPNNYVGIISPVDSSQFTDLQKTFYKQKYGAKTNPICMYVTNVSQSVYPNARLELFSKEDHAIIQSEKDRQDNSFFQIHRNGWDTLLIHVLSPGNEVLQKMCLIHPFAYDFYNLPVYPVPGPYTYHYRKTPYKPLKGIYWLEQQGNVLFTDSASIEKYISGTSIRFLENGTALIPNPDEAIALEKKLLHSPAPIRLLPVSEREAGNGIRWYTNTFTVAFYKHVSDKRIKEIFAKYKITNYNKQNYNGENTWIFSLETILDRKYIVLLDQLWELKEVSWLTQEEHEIADEDFQD